MDGKDQNNMAARIRELRLSKGLTQTEVARSLNVSPGYISNVENGRVQMSLAVLTRFAKLTDITLDALIGQSVPAYSESAMDHALLEKFSKLTAKEKDRLLRTLEIWFPSNEK